MVPAQMTERAKIVDVDVEEEGEFDDDDEEFCSVCRVSSHKTLRRGENTHFANFAMGPRM